MVGTTLVEIREHVEAIASDDGAFSLVCARTGERPIPTAGLRFPTRAAAESAARATEQYRAALRRYDPRVPYFDVIVRQDPAVARIDGSPPYDESAPRDADESTLTATEAPNDAATDATSARISLDDAAIDVTAPQAVDYCHSVAAAVFEALSAAGHDAVESAVMDTYFQLAETLFDPDDLCLRLLEGVASELDARLDPSEQAAVLAAAATRFDPIESSRDPVAGSFESLQRLGLVGSYACSPWSVDRENGTRSIAVQCSDYALSPRDGRLPVLPLVFDLFRRLQERPPSRCRVVDTDDGWLVVLALAPEADPEGLVNAPISSVI